MKPKPGFRPLFWLTFFCIPGFLLLMSLGVWQVHRLQWKLGLLHNITLAQKADPVSFKGFMALQPSDVPLFWRHVEVQGDYVQPSIFTLFVYQPYRGGIGWRVVSLFREQETGSMLLVDRGLLTEEERQIFENKGKQGNQTDQPLLLKGRVWPYDSLTRWTPETEREEHQAYALAPKSWHDAGFPEAENLRLFYLKLENTDVILNGKIRPYAVLPKPHNRHAGYAATWFGLAVALVIFYLLYHKARGRLRLFF